MQAAGLGMPRAIWKRILDASRAEVLLAVDLYNRPRAQRRVEAFFVHMHLAWLYLLHAHFHKEGIDYRIRKPNSNRFVKIDGEPKTWDLAKCVTEHWQNPNDPVRRNLELTIALRNKIEHRFTKAELDVPTSGYAQATLLNYEHEATTLFGSKYSLANVLRFPVFIGTFTRSSADRMKKARRSLPAVVRNFIDDFQVDMDPEVIEDSRYEFRVHLVRQLGPKTEADLALNFVREDDLSEEERMTLAGLGREGTVIVREQERQVASAGLLKPTQVMERVHAAIPYVYNMHHFAQSWKHLGVRPPGGADHPERTDERYCVYDKPHRDYLYKPVFVDKLIRSCRTESGFRKTTGTRPRLKSAEGI